MKDTKSLLLLIVSLLLIVVSLALLWTWGYNYGREKARPIIVTRDTFPTEILSEDSMNEVINQAVGNLNNLDSTLTKIDSLKLDISQKINEFYKIRDEIAAMKSISNENAEKNINDLLLKVNELSSQNQAIIKENQRLITLVSGKKDANPEKSNNNNNRVPQNNINNQKTTPNISAEKSKKSTTPKIIENNIIVKSSNNTPNKSKTKVDSSNLQKRNIINQNTDTKLIKGSPKKQEKVIPVPAKVKNKANTASFFAVSSLDVKGLYENDNKYLETNLATQTNKLNGSFELKNLHSEIKNGDIHIVITKPDGKLLQSSTWDAGTFETDNGRRVYSTKVKYSCDIGETKKLNFSINADQYPKGNYSIDFYQNGYIIGKTVKALE
jgi:hypothetical protein